MLFGDAKNVLGDVVKALEGEAADTEAALIDFFLHLDTHLDPVRRTSAPGSTGCVPDRLRGDRPGRHAVPARRLAAVRRGRAAAAGALNVAAARAADRRGGPRRRRQLRDRPGRRAARLSARPTARPARTAAQPRAPAAHARLLREVRRQGDHPRPFRADRADVRAVRRGRRRDDLADVRALQRRRRDRSGSALCLGPATVRQCADYQEQLLARRARHRSRLGPPDRHRDHPPSDGIVRAVAPAGYVSAQTGLLRTSRRSGG